MGYSRKTETSSKYIQEYVLPKWRDAHPGEEPNARDVGLWAIRCGLLQPRNAVSDWAARKVREALRDEYIIDPTNGRKVRRNHALYRDYLSHTDEAGRKVYWIDIDEAAPEDYAQAEAWRRRGIAADCKQLKNDHDYFVGTHPGAEDVIGQLGLNFTEDAEDADQPTEYPATRPPEDVDDGEDGGGGEPVPA